MAVRAGLIGKNERAARTQIGIALTERSLIEGSKVVTNGKVGTLQREFELGVAVIAPARCGIEGPVTSGYVDVAGRIGGGASVAGPNTSFCSVRRYIECGLLGERFNIDKL